MRVIIRRIYQKNKFVIKNNIYFKKKKVKIIENVLVVVVLITYLKVNLDKNSTNIDFYYYI
jgi:hypothetical protein